MKKHQIRIVGGIYKRTPINVIDSESLRPTSDRIRETLFNWLNYFWDNEFNDKIVLDLFAGSGALGIEAASRGAKNVLIIDNCTKVINQIKNTINKLNANNVNTRKIDAIKFLQTPNQAKFDLVFLDPPFGQDLLNKTIPLLNNILAINSLVYIESEANYNLLIPDNFEVLRQNKSGNVQYCLIRFAASQKSSNNGNKY